MLDFGRTRSGLLPVLVGDLLLSVEVVRSSGSQSLSVGPVGVSLLRFLFTGQRERGKLYGVTGSR